jgi:SAM-dependent methyltransferase
MDRDDWNRRYEGSELFWTAEPNRFLVDEVGSLARGRALDLGCGEGRNAVWLAELGFEVDAVDFSDVALEKARRVAEARGVAVSWIEADLESWSPVERVYDLVIVFYLQLPWHRMRPVLHRAARAVAPRGTLLLVGHDRTNLERGHGGPKSPDVLYAPDEISAELPGLGIVEAARRERSVETDQGTRTAIDCLVRAVAGE